MSMKDNVDYIKQELSTEDKIFEGTVKLERFWKKFKFLIIGAVIVIIGAFVGLSYKKSADEQNKIAANEALNVFVQDYKNEKALAELKELDKNLYEVALYLKASKNNEIQAVNAPYLSQLMSYNEALNKNDLAKLNDLSMDNRFLLKEFAIFNKAMLLTEEKKYEEAKSILKLIPETSQANQLAQLLLHHIEAKL